MANGQEEEARRPLLSSPSKSYRDGCPGCAMEKKLEQQEHGLPMVDFLRISVIVLANALPISSLYPFLYFMIRDLHVAKRTEDIGFYAGFVGAAYMVGRALTSTLWGVAADRIGRKPVILLGILSVLVTPLSILILNSQPYLPEIVVHHHRQAFIPVMRGQLLESLSLSIDNFVPYCFFFDNIYR